MQNTINCFDIKINNFTNAIDEIKEYLSSGAQREISLDLSSLNIFDAAKILVLSSAYHYGKYPDGKIKCHCNSDTIKSLIADISTSNLELV